MAYTAPLCEMKACDRLLSSSVDAFCPTISVKRRRKRPMRNTYVVETVVVPMFSRYLFVAASAAIHVINSVTEILRLLVFGGVRLTVPGDVVEELKLNSVEVDRTEVTGFIGQVGDSLRFATDHVFAGFLGRIKSLERLSSHSEVSVWVNNMLGSERLINVPVRAIGEIAHGGGRWMPASVGLTI